MFFTATIAPRKLLVFFAILEPQNLGLQNPKFFVSMEPQKIWDPNLSGEDNPGIKAKLILYRVHDSHSLLAPKKVIFLTKNLIKKIGDFQSINTGTMYQST